MPANQKPCIVCNISGHKQATNSVLLTCSICNKSWHNDCIRPRIILKDVLKMSRIPSGPGSLQAWTCNPCAPIIIDDDDDDDIQEVTVTVSSQPSRPPSSMPVLTQTPIPTQPTATQPIQPTQPTQVSNMLKLTPSQRRGVAIKPAIRPVYPANIQTDILALKDLFPTRKKQPRYDFITPKSENSELGFFEQIMNLDKLQVPQQFQVVPLRRNPKHKTGSIAARKVDSELGLFGRDKFIWHHWKGGRKPGQSGQIF